MFGRNPAKPNLPAFIAKISSGGKLRALGSILGKPACMLKRLCNIIKRPGGIFERLENIASEYWLLLFFIAEIAYLELIYRLYIFKGINWDYFFPFIFSLPAGAAIFLLVGLLPAKAAGIAARFISFLISLVYAVQIVYYGIFRMPLSLYSIGGAGDAAQFTDIIAQAVRNNAAAVILLFIPGLMLAVGKRGLLFTPGRQLSSAYVLLFCVVFQFAAVVSVSLTGDSPASQNTLYFKTYNPELSIGKLGLLTTMRKDLQKLVADSVRESLTGKAAAVSKTFGGEAGTGGESQTGSSVSGIAAGANGAAGNALSASGNEARNKDAAVDSAEKGAPGGNAYANTSANTPADTIANIPADASANASVNPDAKSNVKTGANSYTAPAKPYNVMDIDFEKLLAASGNDKEFYAMNKYFSTVMPTAANRYTGMFKGDNLILITAEAFSPYFITPELTPTLYMMSTEGFVFTNFYNPVWGVSTSDGEYVADTGLIPKSGVWSFMKSGANYMPFCMGNQFRKLGYSTKAYHNHTYTYYKRDISHPNMGYDYKGVGNGLDIKKTWPESDLELINATESDLTPDKPFHIYYMTVSGHMNYSFKGNYMAYKNRDYVENLPYSEPSKAYIACNLEFEFAMRALIEKLESLGIADKTVIAISGDHYPYGLPRECIDELAGHKVEDNFELYKSTFILWKKGMETVVVDKPCSSLDRIPTLSNLFGLEYDSRLLMGTDILSDSPALVIFSNRSWITDRARYNSAADKVEFFDGTEKDDAYVRKVNRIVADKFKYSEKILDTDYYRRILKK